MSAEIIDLVERVPNHPMSQEVRFLTGQFEALGEACRKAGVGIHHMSIPKIVEALNDLGYAILSLHPPAAR